MSPSILKEQRGLACLLFVIHFFFLVIVFIPLLFFFSSFNGVAWGFWPILFTIPFHLPGIRPRELAVAVSVTMMLSSAGIALGPLVTGFLQQSLGDLRTALFIVSFGALSLCAVGLLLRFGAGASTAPAR